MLNRDFLDCASALEKAYRNYESTYYYKQEMEIGPKEKALCLWLKYGLLLVFVIGTSIADYVYTQFGISIILFAFFGIYAIVYSIALLLPKYLYFKKLKVTN